MQPTVQSILELPAVQAARPHVVGGERALDTPVRWVHVSELLDLTGLITGGELVLTTGLELAQAPHRAASYLASLATAGAAALMVERASTMPEVAAALRRAARDARIPVITLDRTLRFIDITETVHRQIVAEQFSLVEKTRDAHEVFTQLSLDNAGAAEVVARASTLLGGPVVLEDLRHLVLAYAVAGRSTTAVLANWERRSRATPGLVRTGRSGPEHWLHAPVGVSDRMWGRLVALEPTRDEAFAAMVLERAAQTLTINRLAERDQSELAHQAKASLLHALRSPRGLTEDEARARAEALGLRAAPHYLALALHSAPAGAPNPLETQYEQRELLESLARAGQQIGLHAVAASLDAHAVGALVALPSLDEEDAILHRLARELTTRNPAGARTWRLGVGRPRGSVLCAAALLDEAAHVAQTALTLGGTDRGFYRVTDVRLRGLLSLLRDDARVQQFAASELAGVLDLPPRQRADLLDLLGRYLAAGGNKSALARSGYHSRPTLYARLATLEAALEVDLAEAESRTSLHVALMIHRVGSGGHRDG
ncbi:PucR family transcriptional regulator ligand-binding domain-containing protein [Micrococcales bacterium 31B]|nr:PucR family transcriptional regulator ligand-binding domain-containing protein [Micrococcales bacterium 31B]